MSRIFEAKEDIYDAFFSIWNQSSLTSSIVFFDKKIEDDDEKDASKVWARISIRHFDNGFSDRSLANSEAIQKYDRNGVVTVGIFTPLDDNIEIDSNLTSLVMSAFEGIRTKNEVWFRNVRFNEVGVSGAWYHTNVKADFEYSEYK